MSGLRNYLLILLDRLKDLGGIYEAGIGFSIGGRLKGCQLSTVISCLMKETADLEGASKAGIVMAMISRALNFPYRTHQFVPSPRETRQGDARGPDAPWIQARPESVSYTHLTLPTILLV